MFNINSLSSKSTAFKLRPVIATGQILTIISLAMSVDVAAQVANGNTIQFPNNQYWLVRNSNGAELCQGSGNDLNAGNAASGDCTNLVAGNYTAHNLTTSAPPVSVTITGSTGGGGQPVANGSTIQFPNNQYWLVRDSNNSEICQGSGNDLNAGNAASGDCSNLANGNYHAFNLTTDAPAVTITITDGDNGGGGGGGGQPTANGATIQFPNNQYWLVRNSSGTEICQGSGNDLNAGNAASGDCSSLTNGDYLVFNLTTDAAAVTVTITDGENGGGGGQPTANGSTIEFPNNQYWLVRNSGGSEICQGSGNALNAGNAASGDCTNLVNGDYSVFNLTTDASPVVVTIFVSDGGSGGGTIDDFPRVACHTDTVNKDTPLRKLVEHCGFSKSGFYIGGMIKDQLGLPWAEIAAGNPCWTTSASTSGRFGDCFNGEAGSGYAHVETAKREFNIISAENHQKFSSSQIDRPDNSVLFGSNLNAGFDRGDMNAMLNNVNFGSNQLAVHGHAIAFEDDGGDIGSGAVPSWFYSLSTADARDIMKDRVQRELRYYRGKNLPYWDVINEALDKSGISAADVNNFRNSPTANMDNILSQGILRQKLGANWVEDVFTWAREELNSWGSAYNKPDLIYNENDVLWDNPKSDAMYELIRHVNRNDKLIDGVGFQAHMFLDSKPNNAEMNTVGSNMQQFANGLGLNLFITEIDVRVDGSWWNQYTDSNRFEERPLTANENTKQSERYAQVLNHCLNIPSCKGWQTWGMSDRFAWTPGLASLFSGYGTDESGSWGFTKKPAYYAVHKALCDRINGEQCTYENETDTEAPTVAFNSPDPEASGAVMISGAAQDDSGVSQLRVLLQGESQNNQRYNFTTGQFSASTVYTDTVKNVTLTNESNDAADWNLMIPNLDPGDYKLRTKAWDNLNNASTWSTFNFTIDDSQIDPDTTAPTISYSSPEAETSAGSVTISGAAQDESGIRMVRALVVGLSHSNQRYNFATGQFSSSTVYGDTVKVAALSSESEDGADWSFTIPNLEPGNYRLRTKVWDNLNNGSVWFAKDFTVKQSQTQPDTTAPTISYSSPGSEANPGAVTISGNAQDESGILMVRALVLGLNQSNQRYNFATGQFSTSTNYANTVKTAVLTNQSGTSSDWSFTIPNLEPGDYRVRTKVWDKVTNGSVWFTYNFTIATGGSGDSEREVAMRNAMNAMESYNSAHGTFRVANSGWNGNGSGWFFYDGNSYPNSVADALTSAGYPVILTDPLYVNSNKTIGDFLVYQCKDRVGLFSRHGTEQETTSTADKNWWNSNSCPRHPLDSLNADYFILSQ